ncbi:MAG: hypothetical protein DMG11_22800 [Acidobacteria bacterium]|nr:MAG: hypothetical protein DMG11_22800 [Acidobacteriota bacterium]
MAKIMERISRQPEGRLSAFLWSIHKDATARGRFGWNFSELQDLAANYANDAKMGALRIL